MKTKNNSYDPLVDKVSKVLKSKEVDPKIIDELQTFALNGIKKNIKPRDAVNTFLHIKISNAPTTDKGTLIFDGKDDEWLSYIGSTVYKHLLD